MQARERKLVPSLVPGEKVLDNKVIVSRALRPGEDGRERGQKGEREGERASLGGMKELRKGFIEFYCRLKVQLLPRQKSKSSGPAGRGALFFGAFVLPIPRELTECFYPALPGGQRDGARLRADILRRV